MEMGNSKSISKEQVEALIEIAYQKTEEYERKQRNQAQKLPVSKIKQHKRDDLSNDLSKRFEKLEITDKNKISESKENKNKP